MVVKAKKQKVQKKKEKKFFKNYKKCLEAAQMQRKINYLRKKKLGIDSSKENNK